MTRDQLIEKRRQKKRRKKILAIGGVAAAAAVALLAGRAISSRKGTTVGRKPQQETVEWQDPEIYDTDTAQKAAPPDGRTGEIGRASCRERV